MPRGVTLAAMSAGTAVRNGYVRAARATAAVAEKSGVAGWLLRRRHPFPRHLGSLFAIYDVERMIPLDVPWWTYDAARDVEEWLAARDGNARVFEYGSGASTLWLARRAGEVCSVEHDAEFVDVLRPIVAPLDNVHLRCVEATPRRPDSTAVSDRRGHQDLDFEDYVRSIGEAGGVFDLVVIDGRARSACLEAAVPYLADGGVIVFDNAGRPGYQAALEHCGLSVDRKRGWAPSLPYREVTALLRRPEGTSMSE